MTFINRDYTKFKTVKDLKNLIKDLSDDMYIVEGPYNHEYDMCTPQVVSAWFVSKDEIWQCNEKGETNIEVLRLCSG